MSRARWRAVCAVLACTVLAAAWWVQEDHDAPDGHARAQDASGERIEPVHAQEPAGEPIDSAHAAEPSGARIDSAQARGVRPQVARDVSRLVRDPRAVAAAIAELEGRLVVRAVRIEPSSALSHFHDALSALERGERRVARVLHYGDSNVAADLWSAVTRRMLEARYGSAGYGYLLPPRHGSRRDGPLRIEADGWESRRRGYARSFGPADGLWGLAGIAVEPRRGGRASFRVRLPDDVASSRWRVEIHALARPNGGALELRLGDRDPERIELARASAGLSLARRDVPPGEQRIEVRGGGRARLLGVALERDAPGISYDVLGINGHRASAILHWDTELLRAQLHERPPDLVVLSYGGNEALDEELPMSTYREHLRDAVTRMRALTPSASCLLVGPVSSCPDRPRMREVTQTQRRIAAELGCGFWDAAAVSGGHGALCAWAREPGLVAGDRLHLGARGYALVGHRFGEALLENAR